MATQLTYARISKLTSPSRYFDGGSVLHLLIKKTGRKYWVFRFKHDGKRQTADGKIWGWVYSHTLHSRMLVKQHGRHVYCWTAASRHFRRKPQRNLNPPQSPQRLNCQSAPKTFHLSASNTFQSSDLSRKYSVDEPNGAYEFRQ